MKSVPYLFVACAALTSFCIAGCNKTTIRLEFDKMAGTTFPPEIRMDGDTFNLSKIYDEAGFQLDVIEDETNIPVLTDLEGNALQFITPDELDNIVECAHRDGFRCCEDDCDNYAGPTVHSSLLCTETRYHLYGIVVNHYYQRDRDNINTQNLNKLGLMWTNNRRAFVMFYRAIDDIRFDKDKKYLRSAAHEIGHAFNLHHQDGIDTDDISSLMLTTLLAGSAPDFLFSDASQNHLDNHPDNCKYPGVGSFECAIAAHSHPSITIDCDCECE